MFVWTINDIVGIAFLGAFAIIAAIFGVISALEWLIIKLKKLFKKEN